MRKGLLFLIICCFLGLGVFAEEIPFHVVKKGENGLSVIVDQYYDIYAGENNGYSGKPQYLDSLVIWNRLEKSNDGNPIIHLGQKLYLKNSTIFLNELGNLQEQKEETTNENEDAVETTQKLPVSQGGVPVQTDELKSSGDNDDRNKKKDEQPSSISWVWLLLGLLAGSGSGVFLFYLLYVKKLKTDYRYMENELHQVKFDLDSEKTNTGSELPKLRSENRSLKRRNKELNDENNSLREEIAQLTTPQRRANENKIEGTSPVSTNQISTQKSEPATTLYADAIIDDYFEKVREIPNEDSIFVLHLNGENLADFSIYEPAYQRVVVNPSFLEGCEIQVLGSTGQLEIMPGSRAQRETSDGKWKVINKLNVIIR
jgi:regulator of replication initiation timing